MEKTTHLIELGLCLDLRRRREFVALRRRGRQLRGLQGSYEVIRAKIRRAKVQLIWLLPQRQ